MDGLKCCPFCGGRKTKIEVKNGARSHYEKDGMLEWRRLICSVRCNTCHARGAAVGADIPADDQNLKAKNWNK